MSSTADEFVSIEQHEHGERHLSNTQDEEASPRPAEISTSDNADDHESPEEIIASAAGDASPSRLTGTSPHRVEGSLLAPDQGAQRSPKLLSPTSPAPESSVGSPLSSAHGNSPALHPSSSSRSLWTHHQAIEESTDPFRGATNRSLERDELLSVLEALHGCPAGDLQTKLHLGGHLHRMLVEGTSSSAPAQTRSYRDDFREAGGFLVVVQLISTLDHQQIQSDSQADSALQIEIFKLALSVLSASLIQHPLNIKAFEVTVGWKGLLDAIRIAANGVVPADHVLGSLLALAVADVPMYAGRVVSMRRFLADHAPTAAAASTSVASSESDHSTESLRAQLIQERIKAQWTPIPSIVFPNAIRIMLQMLLPSASSSTGDDAFTVLDSEGMQIVLYVLLRLVSSSRRNQFALANAGLSALLLDEVLSIDQNTSISITVSKSLHNLQAGGPSPRVDPDNSSTKVPPLCRSLLAELLKRLYGAGGIPDIDGRKLLVYLSSTPSRLSSDATHDRILDLLLDVASSSKEPNTVLFSMAEYGHASLAFSTLRRPFPPSSSSRGFTFVTTFSIDRIEPSLSVDLLTIYDVQKSIHVQLSIEPGTGLFSYATSPLTSSSPTRFNNAVFVTGRRYHLVFLHLHPRGGAQMSPAKLFVDGQLMEEKLAPWPAHSSASMAGSRANPVRAILGSPPASSNEMGHVTQDAAARTNKNRLVWSLGPTMLLDDAVPDDLPLVLYELGPRYTGNAQDSLGRFLTYRASANINLRLDHIARRAAAGTSMLSEKELSTLPLVTAIAGRASELVPEDRLYFVVNAANTATFDRSRTNNGRLLSTNADPSRRSGSRVILNQAVPLNRDAIGSSFGLAKLYGEPALIVPRPLDEMIWKLGGCDVLLKLISAAETSEMLAKTLRLSLDLISHSWRLSEDVERCKGYEVLGSLLHGKGRLFNDEIAGIIFEAVGIDISDSAPGDTSLLVNPFLYRIVMLDFELWSQTSQALREKHLDHFTLLLRSSRHRRVSQCHMC